MNKSAGAAAIRLHKAKTSILVPIYKPPLKFDASLQMYSLLPIDNP
jgi:hypothetical protein